ncbi:hypothetical protein, conserved [Plasmodium gonderi]|uniref:Surface-related antigen SRA n=1 Tax=Plasmodium gonderi TaxID=77519 RepID=A0A1Y1JKF7_PLAGO|nr:hypothetical protein, conserved [Plasmodium gonderi]GAW82921.1 hypothetical protein, conserved [Plasmodium gonderi]
MFWGLKKKVFVLLCFYPYVNLVNSDKTVNIASTLTSGLASSFPTALTSVATDSSNALLNTSVKPKGSNMHTCQSAGCSSYKNIINHNEGDCLNGFICKECKQTHAKNPNICFYSSLEEYENLYEGLLEEFTQTPYDNFKIPLEQSRSDKGSKNDESNDNVINSSLDDEKENNKSKKNHSPTEEDAEEDARNERKYKRKGNSSTEEADDEEEEDDDNDDSDEEDKRDGNNMGKSSAKRGKKEKNEGNNFDEENEAESFLEKPPAHVHKKIPLYELLNEENKNLYREGKRRKRHVGAIVNSSCGSLEPHSQFEFGIEKTNESLKHYNHSNYEKTDNGQDYYYSFIGQDQEKEKTLYKRFKISLNKYEEYLKNKLNKCDVSENGMSTIYIKLLLQIVKDKNDIYLDVSRRSTEKYKGVSESDKENPKGGNESRFKGSREESEEEDEENREDDDNEESGNKYSYVELQNVRVHGISPPLKSDEANQLFRHDEANQLFRHDEANQLLRRDEANQLLRRDEANQLLRRDEANELLRRDEANELLRRDEANELLRRDEANELLREGELYSFYQIKDDLDGDSMGNYYKSKNGFFNTIFNKVFRRKSDSDEESDDEPQERKRKRWKFPWKKRRKNKGKKNDNYDDSDSDSDDDSDDNRSGMGGLSGRNGRNNDDESSDDNDDSDGGEYNGSYGNRGGKKKKKKKKGRGDKKGDKDNDGEGHDMKSKIGNFFTRMKKKIIPDKQKLHIEAFFNSIIVKSCKNSLKWKGNMFKKQSLVEMTLKVPVKMKYIKGEPLNFFRSGYEVILTCRNCDEILFNSCVQVYCTKKGSHVKQILKEHNENKKKGTALQHAATTLAAGTIAAGAMGTTGAAMGSFTEGTTLGSPYNMYSGNSSDFAPLPMYDYNNPYFPGNINSTFDYFSGDKHTYIKKFIIFATLLLTLMI